MWCMGPKVGMSGEHHRYYKHTKFRQNPRGDPKFLVDLTRNDPYSTSVGYTSLTGITHHNSTLVSKTTC